MKDQSQPLLSEKARQMLAAHDREVQMQTARQMKREFSKRAS